MKENVPWASHRAQLVPSRQKICAGIELGVGKEPCEVGARAVFARWDVSGGALAEILGEPLWLAEITQGLRADAKRGENLGGARRNCT